MKSFEVQGGYKLSGNITPQGAKNEALQVICAVLLTSEPVTICNIPNIIDATLLIDVLVDLGVKVTHVKEGEYLFNASQIDIDKINDPAFQKKQIS